MNNANEGATPSEPLKMECPRSNEGIMGRHSFQWIHGTDEQGKSLYDFQKQICMNCGQDKQKTT